MNDYLRKQQECKHDKDLEFGMFTSTYYGSDRYNQDINCSECHKALYFMDSDRVTIWKYNYGKNPTKIDPKTCEDRRLLKFVGKSLRDHCLDMIKLCEHEIRMEGFNKDSVK